MSKSIVDIVYIYFNNINTVIILQAHVTAYTSVGHWLTNTLYVTGMDLNDVDSNKTYHYLLPLLPCSKCG